MKKLLKDLEALALASWMEKFTAVAQAHEEAVASNAKADPDGSKRRALIKTMFGSSHGSQEADEAFAGFVKQIVNLSIWPQLPWLLAGCQEVSLRDDEIPMIVTETDDVRDYVYATTVGQNGGTVQSQIFESLSQAYLQMRKYSTQKDYPLVDLQAGRLDMFSTAMKQATRNLAAKIDRDAKTVLQACALSSGLRAATFALHPDIKTATLPDTNILDLSSGYGTAGVWTVPKYRKILEYFAKFGMDVEKDGRPLRPKAIFQSVLRKPDKWTFVDRSAGYAHATAVLDPADTVPEGVRLDIWRGGELNNIFGYPITEVNLNTLDATEVWVFADKPAGLFYHKPGLDEVVRDQSNNLRAQNKESVLLSKVGLITALGHHKYRVLKVTL